MKKLMFLILVISFWCCPALALTRMGPPTAALKAGQFAIVPEFSYSENDVDREGSRGSRTVRLNTLLGRISYGLRDDCELYVRGGTGGGSAWIPITLGAGAKWTFYQGTELPWGALFQLHWYPGTSFATELDLYEVQIAVGTTYRFDRFSVYGGPFLHFLRGDEDSSVFGTHVDLEEESVLGVYAGARADLTNRIGLDVELQVTADAFGVGFGLPLKF
jgi:hypothetical protein